VKGTVCILLTRIIVSLSFRNLFNWIPDKLYLKMIFPCWVGQKLNLKNPKTYSEKLQWLKLYDRKPEYSKYVDKYAVRTYISETIGEQYLIPLIGVYDSVEEIDWDSLPNKFVLKCTHGSGSNIICSDKNKLELQASKIKLNKWMKKNWFWFAREWPYKDLKPRIICEKYLADESGVELKDYKIFCFSGEPKIIQVDYNRFFGHKRNMYDTEWNYIPVSHNHLTDAEAKIKKPAKIETMLELARVLAKDYPHVRVDFYSINDKIYFGELTFYPGAGFGKFEPKEFGIKMGSWIKLPIAKIEGESAGGTLAELKIEEK
jgi:hypothetical protein